MNRKRGLIVLSVLTLLLILPAVAGLAGGQQEKVTLKVMNYAQVEKAFVVINQEFMKKHPNIMIDYEPTPYDNYNQKYGAAIATKSGPDVTMNELMYVYDTADAYVPLNDKLESEPQVFEDLLAYNMMYRYMDPSGPLLMLPMSYNGNVMYYNKDILRQAGVDPENPPRTWDDFGRACDAIKRIGKAPIAVAGREVPLVWDWPEVQKNFWTSDQDILELGRGNIPWSDPRMQNGLKLLASMADKGWFQQGWPTIQGIPDALDLFSSGGAAFIGSIISDVANWKQYEDALGQDKVGVMLWPAVDPNNPMMKKFSGFQGFSHGITTWCKNQDEAWEYVKFLASTEGGNLFLKHAGGQPCNKNFDRSIAGSSPNFAKIQEIIQNNTVQAILLLSSRELDALARGWTQYGTGDITIAEWTKSLQDALDQSRDKKLK
ncbi:MAG: extracellular solute-binding protein [Spirochaetales bacterium]|nr:extracellular solute-binding protein [Spirochaetales bacterium]